MLAGALIPVSYARQNCDMPEEMRQDCVDLVITAIERFQGNYEVRATLARNVAASSPPTPCPLSALLRRRARRRAQRDWSRRPWIRSTTSLGW